MSDFLTDLLQSDRFTLGNILELFPLHEEQEDIINEQSFHQHNKILPFWIKPEYFITRENASLKATSLLAQEVNLSFQSCFSGETMLYKAAIPPMIVPKDPLSNYFFLGSARHSCAFLFEQQEPFFFSSLLDPHPQAPEEEIIFTESEQREIFIPSQLSSSTKLQNKVQNFQENHGSQESKIAFDKYVTHTDLIEDYQSPGSSINCPKCQPAKFEERKKKIKKKARKQSQPKLVQAIQFHQTSFIAYRSGILKSGKMRGEVIIKSIFRRLRKGHLERFYATTDYQKYYKLGMFREKYLPCVQSYVYSIYSKSSIIYWNKLLGRKRATCEELIQIFGSLFLSKRMIGQVGPQQVPYNKNVREFLYKFSLRRLETIKEMPAFRMILKEFIAKFKVQELEQDKTFKNNKEDFMDGLLFLDEQYCQYQP